MEKIKALLLSFILLLLTNASFAQDGATISTVQDALDGLNKNKCTILNAADKTNATPPDGISPEVWAIFLEPASENLVSEKCSQLEESDTTKPDQTDDSDKCSNDIQCALQNLATEIILGLVSIVSIAVATLKTAALTKLQSLVQKLTDRLSDPFYSRPEEYRQSAINVIVVGEGGSGKTSLIKALTDSDFARPDISTDSLDSYSIVREETVTNPNGKIARSLLRIYVDDYIGQRFDQIASNPLLKKRQEIIEASVLVIVVDLFSPAQQGDEVQPQESIDNARVRRNVRFYDNDGIIQILTSILNKGQNIILFINKLDLLLPRDNESVEDIKKKFNTVIKRLNIRGKKLDIIVGSAETGEGICGSGINYNSLIQIVRNAAKPIDTSLVRQIEKQS